MNFGSFKQTLQDHVLKGGASAVAIALRETYDPTTWLPWQLDTLRAIHARIVATDIRVETPNAFDHTLTVIHGFPDYHQERLRALVTLVEGASLATHRKRFTRLSDSAQDQILASWGTSRIATRRAAFHGLKSVCMMGFYSDDASWHTIGYSLEENPGLPDDLRR